MSEFSVIQSPAAAQPPDGALAGPRLYAPRWRWSAAPTSAPAPLGQAPQCHPLDILGVLTAPPNAASTLCALPEATLTATKRATQTFGAPPFAVLLAILATCEAGFPAALRLPSDEPPIRVGLLGPGAVAVRRAAMAILPEAAGHLIDLYAVRGAPDAPDDDPLPRGVWPVLCPAYLPAEPAPTRIALLLPAAHTRSPNENPQCGAFVVERAKCSQRHVLASICADDADALYLPPDARRRVTALPRLMDRLYAALATLALPNGALVPIQRFESDVGASLATELAETAFELAMIARAHQVAFYARVRPARTGSVHRAAAAMLRHRPPLVSPTTLTSGISGGDLRVLEAAGWLEARDEETARGLAYRFTPTAEFSALDVPELPRKRPSQPLAISVLYDEG